MYKYLVPLFLALTPSLALADDQECQKTIQSVCLPNSDNGFYKKCVALLLESTVCADGDVISTPTGSLKTDVKAPSEGPAKVDVKSTGKAPSAKPASSVAEAPAWNSPIKSDFEVSLNLNARFASKNAYNKLLAAGPGVAGRFNITEHISVGAGLSINHIESSKPVWVSGNYWSGGYEQYSKGSGQALNLSFSARYLFESFFIGAKYGSTDGKLKGASGPSSEMLFEDTTLGLELGYRNSFAKDMWHFDLSIEAMQSGYVKANGLGATMALGVSL